MTSLPATIDHEAAYRACSGREARFDGRLYLGVTSTGIYCRPSCPARTPRPEHCQFFPTAAACVAAGFRACKRCRPDAIPGSRDWDAANDRAARAVRLIRDGVMDTEGVAGLARRLHLSERQLRRLLVEATGATPIQLATTRRAALARQLIEQTSLSLTDVAFSAGFGSVRRFNDAMRSEFGVAPSAFSRGSALGETAASDGAASERSDSSQRPVVTLRLRYRPPLAVAPLRAFVTNHAVPGVERAGDGWHERIVPVPGGCAIARIVWPSAEPGHEPLVERDAALTGRLDLPRLDDLMPAITAVRRWLDLDAHPELVDEALAVDPQLAPLVAARPGIRIPGTVSPVETALMIVLGQQVSVKAARTVQARLVAAYGGGTSESGASPLDPAAIVEDGVTRVRERLGIDGNRAAALVALAGALADGLDVSASADRAHTRAQLLALPRIGPWTADLIALRCLGDPDVFASGDLVARRALARLTDTDRLTPRAVDDIALRWRPWRSYALIHLWSKEYHA